MTLANFQRAYDLVRPNSINLAATGEPLLHPDFLSMIQHVKQTNGGKVIISSNFTTLDDGLAVKIVNSGLDIIKTSIDASTEETYEKVRGRGWFGKIISGVETVQEIKRELSKEKPELRFDFVILKDNYREMSGLIELARRLDIRHVFFRVLQSIDLAQDRRDELLDGVNTSLMLQEAERARAVATKLGVQTNLASLINDSAFFRHKYQKVHNKPLKPSDRAICLLPWLQLFVGIEGDVSPCCSLSLHAKEATVGNIFTEGYHQVWNGEKMQQLRRLFRERRNYEMFEICEHCQEIDFSTLLGYVRLLPRYLPKPLFWLGGQQH